ncbi:DUF262 domain-containing protein [Eubacterium ventriosum]|uniref:DUF262 domain-containing protein n=1 Tax=Eubacterium ventriosum TaxID=39496 RepID=UPI00352140E7
MNNKKDEGQNGNYGIESNTILLKNILEESVYVIPAYQRPYEWKYSQIDKVLEEIFSLADNEASKEEYAFLGSLQFNINENEEKEIIDGQQRLTTLFLIIEAIKNTNNSEQEKIVIYENKKELCIGNCTIRYKNNIKSDKFQENYKYICSKLNNKKICVDDFIERIIFVQIITEKTSLERMLRIFTTMNMEGLPLQSEDVFKTKYADLFNKDSEKVLEILNNKYQEIYNYNNESRNTELSEYDLADVFKFFIMRELEVGKGPTGMKQNAISFFVEKMDLLKEKKEYISVNRVKEIADTILVTQKIIDNQNDKIFESDDQLIWFAREFMWESRYGQLNNVEYFITYVISKEKGNPTIDEVKEALKITEIIWQYCSICRAGKSRIVNQVFEKIIEVLMNSDIDKEKIKKELNGGNLNKKSKEYQDYQYYVNEYKKSITEKCFGSDLRNLEIDLSYMQDCLLSKEKCTIGDVKKNLFYRGNYSNVGKDKRLDIEHIISHTFIEDKDAVLIDSIGNLMYLEASINRNLGNRLKNHLKEDFTFKEDINILKIPMEDVMEERTSYDSYRKSKLKCVEKVIEDYENNSREWDLDMCKKRAKEKILFVGEIYKNNGFDLGLDN